MKDKEMFEVGKRYRFHGEFNYGSSMAGTIDKISDNFIRFIDCIDACQKTCIINMNAIEAIYPCGG